MAGISTSTRLAKLNQNVHVYSRQNFYLSILNTGSALKNTNFKCGINSLQFSRFYFTILKDNVKLSKSSKKGTTSSRNLRFLPTNYRNIHTTFKSRNNQQSDQGFDPRIMEHIFGDGSNKPPKVKLLSPVLWTVLFIGGVFTFSSYMMIKEQLEKKKRRGYKDIPWYWGEDDRVGDINGNGSGTIYKSLGLEGIFGWFGGQNSDPRDKEYETLMNLKKLLPKNHVEHGEKHRRALLKIASLPDYIAPTEVKKAMIMAADNWYGLSKAKKMTFGIIGINLAVFGMWQIPALQRFMYRHFSHNSLYLRNHTLITSVFSHKTFFHLGFNMLALHSFAPSLIHTLGVYEFLAFYLSAGVFSSLISHLAYVLIPFRRALIGSSISLGASGALYSVIVAVAHFYPNTKVNIMFIPYPFEIGPTIKAAVCFDAVMAILNKSIFDHFAHLGGAGFGYLYFANNNELRSMMWKYHGQLAYKILEVTQGHKDR